MRTHEVWEQWEGLFELDLWMLNLVFPGVMVLGGWFATEAIANGSYVLFWAFLAITIASAGGTVAYVRKEIARLQKATQPPDLPYSSAYIRNREIGRAALSLVVWLCSFLFWASQL